MQTSSKKALYATLAIVTFLGVYVSSTQAYGIPLWFVLHFFLLSTVPSPGTMAVTISPANPTQVGEPEEATVIDTSTQMPLQGVNLTISLGEGPPVSTTTTNLQGQAHFSYGGSPTIVSFQKDGYNKVNAVLPSEPAQWTSGQSMSALWGLLGSVPAWAGLILELGRGHRNRHKSKPRTRHP